MTNILMSMLEILIITSSEDLASITIRSQLLGIVPFQPNSLLKSKINSPHIIEIHSYESAEKKVRFVLIYINVPLTRLDEYFTDKEFHADLIFCASRHRSESAKPALLCHTPGNWGAETKLGGAPHQIGKGSGLVLHYFYRGLKQRILNLQVPFEFDQEVTHHGPTKFSLPISFIELGSSEIEWTDTTGARIVAETIIETGHILGEIHFIDRTWVKKDLKCCVGFGGTHYMPNFKRLIELGFLFPHVVPKYAVMELTPEFIQEIQTRILEPIDLWVIDWKGLNSAEKGHLIPLLEATKVPIKKTRELNGEKV